MGVIKLWGYKLITKDCDVIYYDLNEFEIAKEECIKYGGVIYNTNQRIVWRNDYECK